MQSIMLLLINGLLTNFVVGDKAFFFYFVRSKYLVVLYFNESNIKNRKKVRNKAIVKGKVACI